MLDSMTPQQFNMWLAYAEVEPFGEAYQSAIADARSAMHTALLGNVMIGLWSKSKRRINPADIIPKWNKAENKEALSHEQMLSRRSGLKAIFQGLADKHRREEAKRKSADRMAVRSSKNRQRK